jgi:hypothetical protein
MIARIAPIALVIAAAALSSACTRTTAETGPAPAMATVAPAPAPAGGSGCSGALANFQRVIDSDRDTGNVNQSVYKRMTSDLAPAKTACASGRDADSLRQLSGVKSKYGYPEQRG